MKKTIVLATTGAMILGIGFLFPTFVSAQGNGEGFSYKLSQKLNLSEDDVNTALQEVHEEQRVEREAEREILISQAVENGDLTERQQDILTTMHSVMEESRPDSEDWEPGEGRRNMGSLQENMLESLNDAGLDVTQEELDELRDTMHDLGIGSFGNGMRIGQNI